MIERSFSASFTMKIGIIINKGMGAVHTKVKLSNAIDEALVSRQMLAPHLLLSCETEALVDTGATYLLMPAELVQKLGLRIRGQQKAKYAYGLVNIIARTLRPYSLLKIQLSQQRKSHPQDSQITD